MVVMAEGTDTLFVYHSMGKLKLNDRWRWAGGCLQKCTACLLRAVKVHRSTDKDQRICHTTFRIKDSLNFSDLGFLFWSNRTNNAFPSAGVPVEINIKALSKFICTISAAEWKVCTFDSWLIRVWSQPLSFSASQAGDVCRCVVVVSSMPTVCVVRLC